MLDFFGYPFKGSITNRCAVEEEPFVEFDEMRRRVTTNVRGRDAPAPLVRPQGRVKNRAHRALSVRARDVDGLEFQLRIAQRGAEVPDRLQSGLHPEATAGGKFVKEAHRETATATTAETAYPPMISQRILSERRTRSGRPTSPFLQARNR